VFKKIIISIVLVLIIGTIIAVNIVNSKEKGTAVKVEKITKGDIKSTIETSGEIKPKITKNIFFTNDVPLKVKKVFFGKYDRVKKDDRLVEFEIPTGITSTNKDKILNMEKSTIDGVLTEVNVKEDSYTDSVQPAFVIVDTQNLFVNASVKDKYINKIKEGQSVVITCDAFNKDEKYNGKVTRVAPIAVKSTVAQQSENVFIDVEISLDKISDTMKPGLKVNCNITTDEKKDTLIGKFEMLKDDKDDNKFVFIVDSKTKKLKKEKIKLGILSDMEFEILSGVKSGDMIVIDPLPTLKNGDLVKITKE